MGKSYDDFVREARARVRQIDAGEAARLQAAGDPSVTFLDVREAGELGPGTVPGALAIPRGRLESDAPDWIFDPAGTLVVVCNTGKRSALAASTLLEMGFEGVVSLDGGLEAWKAAGLALGPPRPM